ncbi:uncharacterized protein T069G_10446 [Trichoderma breve]|uniref:Uncharacterized protein n=1 Tax=Trichoderma breve TaxID=2034170 RepID=A0A9W9B311_9HYPO|nr:uncharacterized protein T069G_10446 [Trichoderma breve]KAJ4854888.1 hypothetical protein T069G_10446 [Trichoderma breve]
MAKLVVDAAKRNSETGRYDVEKHVCINRFRDRSRSDVSRPDQGKKLASSIDESDLEEMSTFHRDVIKPLVGKFLKSRFQFNPGMSTTDGGKIGDKRTEDRLVSFRNAFYHYQFACIMATRYQRNDDGTCQDISLSQEHGENDMLCNIPSLYLNGEERLHLGEIVNWVEGHYGRLIDKALKGRPQKDNEGLLDYFAKRGLKYLQRSLRHGLNRKNLEEAKKHCDLSHARAEMPFIIGLREGIKPRR